MCLGLAVVRYWIGLTDNEEEMCAYCLEDLRAQARVDPGIGGIVVIETIGEFVELGPLSRAAVA